MDERGGLLKAAGAGMNAALWRNVSGIQKVSLPFFWGVSKS